jgi:starch synthase
MNIIEISSECSGLAQRGGLGGVLWGISDAFHRSGHQVTIIMPYYAEIHHEVHLYTTVSCFYGGEELSVSVFETVHFGIRVLLVHSDRFFRGEYSDVYIDSGKLKRGYFEDDAKRFAFFSLAACKVLQHIQKKERIDVLHCHDWHTGLVPLLIKIHPALQNLQDIYRLFTVHNLEYQGTRPFAKFGVRNDDIHVGAHLGSSVNHGNLLGFLDWYPDLAAIETELFAPYLDRHADIACINPMRAALHSTDRVSTVSPTYAEEICRPDSHDSDFLGGRGLEEDFSELARLGRLSGIANGIDIDYYDPQKLNLPYSHEDRAEGCKRNRSALFDDMPAMIDRLLENEALIGGTETALREKLQSINRDEFISRPLFVAVTRLTGQKIQQFLESASGNNLLQHLANEKLHLVFLGKGDLLPRLADETRAAPNILLFGGFDDDLEKRLFAAADVMLMPSEFEPCGTSQMKAMRYGCLPIAAAVGGLKDTIRHGYNGFLYTGHDRKSKAEAFLAEIRNALAMISNDKKNFLKLQQNAMLTDFSWTEAAAAYLKLMQP